MELKLRSFRIGGFKSLVSVGLSLPGDALILIGSNGAGKSSVLQALSFLQYFSQGRVPEFLADRDWAPIDVRSRLPVRSLRALTYDLGFKFGDQDVEWQFSWNLLRMTLEQEQIRVSGSSEGIWTTILSYERARGNREPGNNVGAGLILKGSVLSALEAPTISDFGHKTLTALLRWGRGVTSLELLSPTAMRRGIRNISSDIGMRGERLAGFLAGLTTVQKSNLVERVRRFYNLSGLETPRKRAGWFDLRLAEDYPARSRFSSAHMSDGFMRILALCAVPEFSDDCSLILLDEVEDGIEPHILPRMINEVIRDSSAQFIVTSHSPLLVNFFEPAEVGFLCRDKDGETKAAKLADLESFKDGLEYFGVGELWANFDLSNVTADVLAAAAKHQGKIVDVSQG